MTGGLQWVLLVLSCLSLAGLGLSGFLVSRAQNFRQKRDARLAMVVTPHVRVQKLEVSAFTQPRHAARPVDDRHGSMGYSVSMRKARTAIRCVGGSVSVSPCTRRRRPHSLSPIWPVSSRGWQCRWPGSD